MLRFLGAIFGALLACPVISLADDDTPRRTINVRNHGAVCNGQHDDTQAFRKAIDKAPVGGTVLIPPGRCVISDTLVIRADNAVSIVGAGRASQIYQRAAKTLFEFQNVNALSIRDVFLGSAYNLAGTALLQLTNSHHMRIDNVTMLGGYYGLYLKGSLLNTIVDLRSGTNFGQVFFASTQTNQVWVFGERFNGISANANTLIAPVLEGGMNGIWIKDNNGEGSINITGGTIEGVGNGSTGVGLKLETTFLPSTISSVHFEANKGEDIALQGSSNVRISGVFSDKLIATYGDVRNVAIADSTAQNIIFDMGDGRYPLGNGAKRIVLSNITTCFGPTPTVISPAPTGDPDFGGAWNGPSSPMLINQLAPPKKRVDIIYTNIGCLSGGF